MSIKIMTLIWEDGPDSQSERFVLLALADHAGDDGTCWPSMKTIARKTCMTERGVRLILRRLEDGGWLETAHNLGRNGVNVYRITPERGSSRTDTPPGTRFRPPRNATALTPERGSPEPLRTIIEPKSVAKATGDPAAVVFGTIREWLAETTDKSDSAVRRILGRWAKNHTHGEIIDACSRAKREGALDPVSFVEGIWKRSRKPSADRRNLSIDDDLNNRGVGMDLEKWAEETGRYANEDDKRDPGRSAHSNPAPPRDAANDVPDMFTVPAEEGG